MSDEKQSESTESNDNLPLEEATIQPEKTLSDEISDLAAEAEATELPSVEAIEEEIEKETPTVEETTETSDAQSTNEAEVVEASAPVKKEIPQKDYSSLTDEELKNELESLLANFPVQDIKEQAENINTAVNALFDASREKAKEAFLEEGGNIIDFKYDYPLKKAYNEVYYDYRNKRAKYFQNRQNDQKENLKTRQGLIEELKALRGELGGAESVNTTFNKFKDVQERWHNAGNIPRDRYNLVWNDYYHHVDNFYELLHLNREFRDRHFQENLTKKLQLIERAEDLSQEPDINRAFRELQLLHRMWKEEIGPVSKEHSDDIWDKFSAATKKIHDAKEAHLKTLEAGYEKNLEKKLEIISNIEALSTENVNSHNAFQNKIKELEALREQFFKAGKVPEAQNEDTWSAFKTAVRAFNHKKNDFYKSQKKEQYDNLNKKLALIKIAEENKDSEDFSTTIDLMKKIQADWKKIGHVPRKDSDKIWKQFKGACNHFFDRMHASKKQANAGEEEAYAKKQSLLEQVKELKLEGDHKENLATIKTHIASWKEIGRVPYAKKKIDEQFNKALDGLFGQLDMSKKEAEMIKYENRISSMSSEEDQRQLDKERFFISKKIEEVKSEINQLENNLGFFQHVPDDNPMVVEVHKNIAKHKESLEMWKAKMKKLRSMM